VNKFIKKKKEGKMPKIIGNIRARLLEETRNQIKERGYKETTVRSVASALSIGLGTLYNYFESKDMLVASFMLEDWNEIVGNIHRRLESALTSSDKLRFIYVGLLDFYKKHEAIFKDPGARRTFSHSTEERHPLLISQISAMVMPALDESEAENKSLLADFISESMLTWSNRGMEYSELEPIFIKLI
jgi:AcrR family transcriptional regulator